MGIYNGIKQYLKQKLTIEQRCGFRKTVANLLALFVLNNLTLLGKLYSFNTFLSQSCIYPQRRQQ
jgi:hypothetical protein